MCNTYYNFIHFASFQDFNVHFLKKKTTTRNKGVSKKFVKVNK